MGMRKSGRKSSAALGDGETRDVGISCEHLPIEPRLVWSYRNTTTCIGTLVVDETSGGSPNLSLSPC
jgi:hypothetical protein